MVEGVVSCNLASPALMNAEQLAIYEHAQLSVEHIGELLVAEGDFREQALSTLDRIRKLR